MWPRGYYLRGGGEELAPVNARARTAIAPRQIGRCSPAHHVRCDAGGRDRTQRHIRRARPPASTPTLLERDGPNRATCSSVDPDAMRCALAHRLDERRKQHRAL